MCNSWILKEIVSLHQKVIIKPEFKYLLLDCKQFWPSAPVHYIKQMKQNFLFFHFYFSLCPGKRWRGKKKNVGAILHIQQLVIDMWVQLSTWRWPLDFQHAALVVSDHSHLNTYKTPAVPLLFICTIFTSCSNLLLKQTCDFFSAQVSTWAAQCHLWTIRR